MELETLYPRLSKGGILIVDDYGFFSGAKKAVLHIMYAYIIVNLEYRLKKEQDKP